MTDLAGLREVAEQYRLALANAEATRAAHLAARAEVNRLQHERRARLIEVIGDGDDPEVMHEAATALGVTTPRIYQLIRDYKAVADA